MNTPTLDLPQVTADYKRAMRRLAATVTIISTADMQGRRHGMTATAVSSVSMDPPSLLICVNRSASIHDPLLARERFAVNVLSTDHEALVAAFGGQLKGDERFAVGPWRQHEGDVPYLEDAQSSMFCDVVNVVSFGTHSIVIGRVTEVKVKDAVHPLVYADGQLGATAPLA